MNYSKTLLAAASLFTAQAALAVPIAVDLSTWQEDPNVSSNGTWTVQPGNDSVKQTINGDPTVFYKNGENSRGTALAGSITVQTTSDDDFIGFVLGYQTGELSSSSADFWLIDWKQNDQYFGGRTALDGIALSHVTDSTTTLDFWDHSGGVTEKARGTNLGSTGWADNTEYLFELVYTSSLIQVLVDNVLEISLSATDAGVTEFTDGAFGFYNYSQDPVLYAGITEEELPFCQQFPSDAQCTNGEVPAPSPLALIALGLAALGIRSKKSLV